MASISGAEASIGKNGVSYGGSALMTKFILCSGGNTWVNLDSVDVMEDSYINNNNIDFPYRLCFYKLVSQRERIYLGHKSFASAEDRNNWVFSQLDK